MKAPGQPAAPDGRLNAGFERPNVPFGRRDASSRHPNAASRRRGASSGRPNGTARHPTAPSRHSSASSRRRDAAFRRPNGTAQRPNGAARRPSGAENSQKPRLVAGLGRQTTVLPKKRRFRPRFSAVFGGIRAGPSTKFQTGFPPAFRWLGAKPINGAGAGTDWSLRFGASLVLGAWNLVLPCQPDNPDHPLPGIPGSTENSGGNRKTVSNHRETHP